MNVLDALPASIVLPAGGGKTWQLANAVEQAASRGSSALVLTHTNAGVDAVQRKLRTFGIPSGAAHVTTITSFAFELVRGYPVLAGITVPPTPDWNDSTGYIDAASRVTANHAIRQMLACSFAYLFVDEYQDCSKIQHAFVLALQTAIPAAAVFGDPLQGIFGFRDPLVDWDVDVTPAFPAQPVDFVPWRWQGFNEPLGAWLGSLREVLRPGSTLDLSSGRSVGVTFRQANATGLELRSAALRARPAGETTVVVAPPDAFSARRIAAGLGGAFTTMEEIAGAFMVNKLEALRLSEPAGYAAWLAGLIKACLSGYGKLDKTVMDRLGATRSVSDLRRPGLERTLAALDSVVSSPNYRALCQAMHQVKTAREGRLHSREAWDDIAAALDSCIDAETDPVTALTGRRERVRQAGRSPIRQVVSRTVLIKGLEFDHVIIPDLGRIDDVCNLYVALTRARRSVTVIGRSPRLVLKETRRQPAA